VRKFGKIKNRRSSLLFVSGGFWSWPAQFDPVEPLAPLAVEPLDPVEVEPELLEPEAVHPAGWGDWAGGGDVGGGV
jgi:hypothetical protein